MAMIWIFYIFFFTVLVSDFIFKVRWWITHFLSIRTGIDRMVVITQIVPILLHHMRISTINVYSMIQEAKIFENSKYNTNNDELMKLNRPKSKKTTLTRNQNYAWRRYIYYFKMIPHFEIADSNKITSVF